MQEAITELLNHSRLCTAVFDKQGVVCFSNQAFHENFDTVGRLQDFNALLIGQADYKATHCRRFMVSSNRDAVFQFEVNQRENGQLYIGQQIDFESIYELNDQLTDMSLAIAKGQPSMHWQTQRAAKTASELGSLLISAELQITYVSENFPFLLEKEVHPGDHLSEVFSAQVVRELQYKIEYLNVFKEAVLEIEGKLFTLSRFDAQRISLIVYPFTDDIMNKYEEFSFLKYKIQKLETELKTREKFLRSQKNIFRTLTGMSKGQRAVLHIPDSIDFP